MSATDRMAAGAALPVGVASRVDRAFGLALEIATALLVVAEIVILFVGIVARYAFNRPLIWSDELASLLFLWLAMLGAVLALRRGEHMRMTALVNRCRLRVRHFFERSGTGCGSGLPAGHAAAGVRLCGGRGDRCSAVARHFDELAGCGDAGRDRADCWSPCCCACWASRSCRQCLRLLVAAADHRGVLAAASGAADAGAAQSADLLSRRGRGAACLPAFRSPFVVRACDARLSGACHAYAAHPCWWRGWIRACRIRCCCRCRCSCSSGC